MIRNLVVIAVAGFVLALAALSAAFAIGGPDALARGGWHWAGDWDKDHWDHDWDIDVAEGGGPVATRTFDWDDSERLSLSIPADVTYTQADGPGKVTVTGPQRLLDRMRIEEGRIRVRKAGWGVGKVKIVMTAPNVRRFHFSGANRLTIENYRQPSLSVDISGASEITARGETEALDIDISGAGEAHMGDLRTRDAEVDISGAGEATVAPTAKARLEISGMGEINLLTDPAELESDISGAGRIHRPRPAQSTTAAPAPAKTTT
ncbi:GIN domain-containing protein [Phenylobacterium sp.]|uniref:GIN domain-containing protein n=1 Tax=Phenylobacterium sp. TaxID=1871053 RepID=UPI00281139F6|nr:DUF2807 domain-containing protein [Phenylobacterium sp.]